MVKLYTRNSYWGVVTFVLDKNGSCSGNSNQIVGASAGVERYRVNEAVTVHVPTVNCSLVPQLINGTNIIVFKITKVKETSDMVIHSLLSHVPILLIR